MPLHPHEKAQCELLRPEISLPTARFGSEFPTLEASPTGTTFQRRLRSRWHPSTGTPLWPDPFGNRQQRVPRPLTQPQFRGHFAICRGRRRSERREAPPTLLKTQSNQIWWRFPTKIVAFSAKNHRRFHSKMVAFLINCSRWWCHSWGRRDRSPPAPSGRHTACTSVRPTPGCPAAAG